jgi:hypothetical protein
VITGCGGCVQNTYTGGFADAAVPSPDCTVHRYGLPHRNKPAGTCHDPAATHPDVANCTPLVPSYKAKK